MVWLMDKHIVEFSKFDSYLQNFSNSVQDSQKVWDAFLKWSFLDVAAAVEALSYGTYPIIKVKDSIFGSAHDYGHFKSSFPNEIWIRRDSVQTFNSTTDATVEYQTGKYLESLILHEMVHWGRYWTSSEDKEEGGLDNGDRFQAEAYKDVNNPHIQ
jgi:hypothetical protein